MVEILHWRTNHILLSGRISVQMCKAQTTLSTNNVTTLTIMDKIMTKKRQMRLTCIYQVAIHPHIPKAGHSEH